MHKKIAVMCLAMVNRKTPMLLHDNTRPHVAQQTLDKLNELKIETVPYPVYSPDLSPTDYHFFQALDLLDVASHLDGLGFFNVTRNQQDKIY